MRRRDFLQLSGLAPIQAVARRSAARQEDPRLKDIEALVTAKMAEYHVPGVALGIVKAGRVETRAFGITSVEGWRLVQHVERKILETYEKLALSPSQATGGNRGVSEDLRGHATPLAAPPRLDQYAGRYERPPVTTCELRVEGGALRSGKSPGNVGAGEHVARTWANCKKSVVTSTQAPEEVSCDSIPLQ